MTKVTESMWEFYCFLFIIGKVIGSTDFHIFSNKTHLDSKQSYLNEEFHRDLFNSLNSFYSSNKCHSVISDIHGFISSDDSLASHSLIKRCSWYIKNGHLDKLLIRPVSYYLPSKVGVLYVYNNTLVTDTHPPRSKLLFEVDSKGRMLYKLKYVKGSVLFVYEPASSTLRNFGSKVKFNISFQLPGSCIPGYQKPCLEMGYCYTEQEHCDGVWNCPLTGTDERGCAGCSSLQYYCNIPKKCYTHSQRCNGIRNCPADAVDERGCTVDQCNRKNETFLCLHSDPLQSECILYAYTCDGVVDCTLGQDERNCPYWPSPKLILACLIGCMISCFIIVFTAAYICRLHQLRVTYRATRMRLLCALDAYNSPAGRLFAGEFRERQPPPNYEQAMRTSLPFDQVFRDWLRSSSAAADESNCSPEDATVAAVLAENDDAQLLAEHEMPPALLDLSTNNNNSQH